MINFKKQSLIHTKSNKVKIDKTAVIHEGVLLFGECEIGKNTIIYPNSVIENSIIGDDCVIKSSYIESSVVKNSVSVGPYAHIRPNSVIGDFCKVGNFVEIKASEIGTGTKVSHLAYVGDATIGESCNIGCGAIFVNYNGKIKNKTVVGNHCFIGSNCNIIAPVVIEDCSYVCAGTTLTVSTKKNDFVIGRCREVIKSGKAEKYLKGSE